MPVARVEDPGDGRLAAYADVTAHERLVSAGRFVVEGRLGVSRLLASGRYEIESLLLSEAAHRALAAQIAEQAPEISVFLCESELFERITGHDFHRGCLALVRRPSPRELPLVLEGARVVVVLERVADPANVGGIFRNAWAFGVDAVLLSPTSADPLYRKAVRTSAGGALAVPFTRLQRESWPRCLELLAQLGFARIALTPRRPSMALAAFAERARRLDKLALLLGSEGEGLSPEIEAMADERVRIPMRPGPDSLNLAVAAGIALSWLCAPEEEPVRGRASP